MQRYLAIVTILIATGFAAPTAYAQAVPTCTLTSSNAVVQYEGGTTLTWTAPAGASVTLAGATQGQVLTVSNTGYVFVNNIRENRVFTMTVTQAGVANTCNASVTVTNIPTTVTTGSSPATDTSLPTCSLSVQPQIIAPNGTGVLSWTSLNGSRVEVAGLGAVAATGQYVIQAPNGERTLEMRVTGTNGRVATCQTVVRSGGYTNAQVNQFGNYVPLSNIPYTGVDSVAQVIALFAITAAAYYALVRIMRARVA
jgi:hypothetical protein